MKSQLSVLVLLGLLLAVMLAGCGRTIVGVVDDACPQTGYMHLEDGRSVLVGSCLFVRLFDSVQIRHEWGEKYSTLQRSWK